MWIRDEREKQVDIGSGSWIADVAAAQGTDRLDPQALQEERLHRARRVMGEEGFRALICTDPANVRYLTELPPNPWGLPTLARCVVLTMNAGPFILQSAPATPPTGLVRRRNGGDRPAEDAEVGMVRVYPDEDPTERLLSEALVLLKNLGQPELMSRIGVDCLDNGEDPDPSGFSEGSPSPIEDARPALLRARSMKDMEELEYLRFVTDLVDMGFHQARSEWLRPGVTEREIAARCQEFLISTGFESVEGILCAAGPNSLLPEIFPTERAIAEGELVIFGIMATGPGGYRVRAQRTFKCGGAARPAENALYRRCHQAMRLVMASCWPGRTTAALLDSLPEDGHLPIPSGYALGLDWYEGFAIGENLGSDETLPEHLYLTLRIHAREGDLAVGLEENFLVSPEGPVYFTCFPLEQELL
jgi:Xaa-Pro aminopeptidase